MPERVFTHWLRWKSISLFKKLGVFLKKKFTEEKKAGILGLELLKFRKTLG